MSGIAPDSIVFADRPVRAAGHVLTADFIKQWDEGNDSFAKDPPNATISVLNSDGSAIEDAVVVLKRPKLEGGDLTFEVSGAGGQSYRRPTGLPRCSSTGLPPAAGLAASALPVASAGMRLPGVAAGMRIPERPTALAWRREPLSAPLQHRPIGPITRRPPAAITHIRLATRETW